MTDRETMQQALEALEDERYVSTQIVDAITALRTALEQPEQEPTQWRDMIVATLVREGINKHKARELADHFAAQRPWVGLTKVQRDDFADAYGSYQAVCDIEQALKERNT